MVTTTGIITDETTQILSWTGEPWLDRRREAKRTGKSGTGRAALRRWLLLQGWVDLQGSAPSERAVRQSLRLMDAELEREATDPGYTSWVRESRGIPSVDATGPVRTSTRGGKTVDPDLIDIEQLEDGVRAAGTSLFKMLQPEEIAERIGLDPARYEARPVKVKHYSGFMKGPDGNPVTVPLFSYTVEFHRRLIQPETLNTTINVTMVDDGLFEEPSLDYERALFIGDMHFGYRWEDMKCNKLIPMMNLEAFDALLQYIRIRRPHYIIFMGDDLDNPESGRHPHSALFRGTLTPAAHTLMWAYGAVRQAAGEECTIVKLMGNHDARTVRSLEMTHPELAHYKPADSPHSNVGFSALMGNAFQALNIHVPQHEHLGEEHGAEYWLWLDDAQVPTHASHGYAIGKGMKLAQKLLDQPGAFHRVCGHVHKKFIAHRTEVIAGYGTVDITAFCPGTLAYNDKRVPANNRGKGHEDWQYGFAEQLLDMKTGLTSTAVYDIVKGRHIHLPEGGVITGVARTEAIAQATGIRAIHG
jgi:hypothetical protein